MNKKQENLFTQNFKPKSQVTQQSFIKQYQTFLQKTRKVTPIKDVSARRQLTTSKQSTKNSPSPINVHSNYSSVKTVKERNPTNLFKSTIPRDLFKKNRTQSSVSPARENEHTNSFTLHINHSSVKENDRPLFDCDSNLTKSQTSFEKSVSAVSIFQESTKQLEELQQTSQNDKPELQKGIVGILSLIKKEKQVILNDMKQMTKQMNKYKNQYEELIEEHDQLQHQFDVVQDGKELQESQKDKVNQTYCQMIGLLKGLAVEYHDVLPELDQGPQEVQQQPDNDEIIILQKLIIKKLVKKIEDLRQFNQLLLTKLKEQ